jgi:hypothetical protein
MPIQMRLSSSKRGKNKLPKTGVGALTCSLKKSQQAQYRTRINISLDEPSIQVLTRNNLPLTLALHTDQIMKDHIHHTGQVHKTLVQSAPKRLETRHNKHVIDQWNFQHNRGIPFPEIPLPLTVKRSGDARHYWKSLQVHNKIVGKSRKTIDSYLPVHVMRMRERKVRNRKIILKNHKTSLKREKIKQLTRRAKSAKSKRIGKEQVNEKYIQKHQLKSSSAQQLKNWSFREKVVETTLEMYAPKKYLLKRSDDNSRSDNIRSDNNRSDNRSGISLDREIVNEPFLKQQGPAGLSINYLRASLTPSPGIPRQSRPKNITLSQSKRLLAASVESRGQLMNSKKIKKIRPQSAKLRRRRKNKNSDNNSNNSIRRNNLQSTRRRPQSACGIRILNNKSSVDFLRDEETGEWIGMKRAGELKDNIDSNQKHITLQNHLNEQIRQRRHPFCSDDKSDDVVIGECLDVYWNDPNDIDKWYSGVIQDYRISDGKHFIVFEDGDSGWYLLKDIKYRIKKNN